MDECVITVLIVPRHHPTMMHIRRSIMRMKIRILYSYVHGRLCCLVENQSALRNCEEEEEEENQSGESIQDFNCDLRFERWPLASVS